MAVTLQLLLLLNYYRSMEAVVWFPDGKTGYGSTDTHIQSLTLVSEITLWSAGDTSSPLVATV